MSNTCNNIYNFCIYQGDEHTFFVEWLNDDGTPIDISLYDIAMQIRVKGANSLVKTLGTSNISVVDDIIEIKLTKSETEILNPSVEYTYDLEMTLKSDAEDVTTIIFGDITVTNEITKE